MCAANCYLDASKSIQRRVSTTSDYAAAVCYDIAINGEHCLDE